MSRLTRSRGHSSGTIAYLNGDDRSGSGRTATGVREVMEHFEQFGLAYASHFPCRGARAGRNGCFDAADYCTPQ